MLRTLWALLRSTHPGPSVAVAALAAIISWGFSLPPGAAVIVVIAVLVNQFSVGLSNDAVDARRDRESGRSDKPLVTGEISLSAVWGSSIAFGLASLGLSLWVHPGVFLAQLVFLVAGWAYNLGLKATVFSALAYAVGFGALPAIVSFAAEPALAPQWWVLVVASGLGIAAHFGNVVPDRDADAQQGIRGLPQLLSAKTVAVSLVVLIAGMAAVLVVGAGEQARVASLIAAALATAVAVVGGITATKAPSSRWAFRSTIAAALVLALGLAVSLEQSI